MPLQKSAVRQSVPRTVAAAKRPVVRKLPLALPHAYRTGSTATTPAPAVVRLLHFVKSPPVRTSASSRRALRPGSGVSSPRASLNRPP